MTSRFRTKSVYKPNVACTYKNAAGNIYTAGSWSPEMADFEMTDVIDESFHSRLAAGEVFANPCELVVKKSLWSTNTSDLTWWPTATPDQKSYWLTGNQTRAALEQAAFPGYDQCQASVPSFDWEAQAKLRALANVDSTPYEFFEDLMEIRETLQFLKSPLSGIANLAKTIAKRRRGVGTKRQLADSLANLWNQYRFAFSPLLRSVMTGMEALANYDNITRPARRTAHGFSSAESQTGTEFHDTIKGDLVRQYWRTSKITCDGHASIYYEVSNPLVDWRFVLGLRLKDLPTTLWQVMPLSFMVDRLFNLSQMIGGLVNLADPTVSILASTFREKTTRDSTVTLWHRFNSSGITTHSISHPDSVTYTTFTYKRSLWDPDVYDTIPRLTPKNLVKDITSILDLISITLSRLR